MNLRVAENISGRRKLTHVPTSSIQQFGPGRSQVNEPTTWRPGAPTNFQSSVFDGGSPNIISSTRTSSDVYGPAYALDSRPLARGYSPSTTGRALSSCDVRPYGVRPCASRRRPAHPNRAFDDRRQLDDHYLVARRLRGDRITGRSRDRSRCYV